jgi:hypothetical protein
MTATTQLIFASDGRRWSAEPDAQPKTYGKLGQPAVSAMRMVTFFMDRYVGPSKDMDRNITQEQSQELIRRTTEASKYMHPSPCPSGSPSAPAPTIERVRSWRY